MEETVYNLTQKQIRAIFHAWLENVAANPTDFNEETEPIGEVAAADAQYFVEKAEELFPSE